MSFRPESILKIAEVTGEADTAVAHHSRVMNPAERPYGTSIGSGQRKKHLGVGWLASTYLATIINDPKNAITKVPAFGQLQAMSTRLIRREVTKYYGLGPSAVNTEDVRDEAEVHIPGETLFSHLCTIIGMIARDPGCAYHQGMRNGFEFSISESSQALSAKVSVLVHREGRHIETWMTTEFGEAQAESNHKGRPAHSVRRTIEVPLEHIEALAELYADTLKHDSTTASFSSPSGSAPIAAASRNENAAPARAAPRRPRKRVATADGLLRPAATLLPLGRERQHDVLGRSQMGILPLGV